MCVFENMHILWQSSLQWGGGRVVGMGWNSNEDLICILEEGTLASYSIHGYIHYSRPISRVSCYNMQCCSMFIHNISEEEGENKVFDLSSPSKRIVVGMARMYMHMYACADVIHTLHT